MISLHGYVYPVLCLWTCKLSSSLKWSKLNAQHQRSRTYGSEHRTSCWLLQWGLSAVHPPQLVWARLTSKPAGVHERSCQIINETLFSKHCSWTWNRPCRFWGTLAVLQKQGFYNVEVGETKHPPASAPLHHGSMHTGYEGARKCTAKHQDSHF